jgi:DeoR family transcriptional regulator of aga operon
MRIRGGAIKTDGGVGIDIHLSDKDKLHYQEKARIGKRAAELIKDHDTIILDSGTTTSKLQKT